MKNQLTRILRNLHDLGARSVTGALILTELHARGPRRMGHLADLAGVGRSNISLMTSRLVRRGLVVVTRRATPDKVTEAKVALTPAGRRLVKLALDE